MSDKSIEYVRNLIRGKLKDQTVDIDTAQCMFYLLAEIEENRNIIKRRYGNEPPATSTEDMNPENPVTERCNDSVTEGESVGGDHQ